jgi:cation diffusion facilitator family transporter
MHSHDINERKTKIVVIIAFVAMVTEIVFGYITNSMALLSDGYHMGAHVLAIGLTWFAYTFARKNQGNTKFTQGTGKVFALSGYTSAIFLSLVTVMIIKESYHKLHNPEEIQFESAILVAVLGLIINGISAVILHRGSGENDHNIHAAYLHVLADAITSIAAILALTIGYFYGILWLDAASGILSGLVIGNWAIKLVISSGKDLLDYKTDSCNHKH